MKVKTDEVLVKALQLLMISAAVWGLANTGSGWSDRIVQQGYYSGSYFISGTIAGLEGDGLLLDLNGDQLLEIAANGIFKFPQELLDNQQYEVAVAINPSNPGQICSVLNEGGVVSGANVTNIQVTCVTDEYDLEIEVSGIEGSGLVVETGAGQVFNVPSDTTVVIEDIPDGTSYDVQVLTQPTFPSQTCSVSSGIGQISGQNAQVGIVCETDTFTIGGQVFGLEGQGLVIQNNHILPLGIVDNGAFVFPDILDESDYSVTVRTQPVNPTQECTIANGVGILAGQDVNNLLVTCETVETDLSISKTDGKDVVVPGQPITYVITAANLGSVDVVGARVVDILPVELEDAQWECTPTLGASCPAAGSGGIDALVDLDAGASAVFVLTALVRENFDGIVENTATITAPPDVTETDLTNNSATDRSGGIAIFLDGFEPALSELKRLLLQP